MSTISRPELIAALRAGDVILADVRSPEAFAAAHIPGALNLPVASIPRDAPGVVPDPAAPIVVYCGGPT